MLSIPSLRPSSQIPRILEALEDLPVAARLLPQLQRLLSNQRASTADIVDVLRLDPSLTGKIISLSNRAYFKGGEPCATLDEAVRRLGFNEVYCAVASIAVAGVFDQKMSLYAMDEGELMESSLAVAVALPEFNREVGIPRRGDELFTIGLLHGLGKLALNAFARKRKEVRSIEAGSVARILKAEYRLFRATHPEVGAALLVEWKFAPALVRIVKFQHDPEKAGDEAPAAHLLRLGVAMAPYVRNSNLHAEDARFLPEVEGCGLDDRRVPSLIERSREMVDLLSQQ